MPIAVDHGKFAYAWLGIHDPDRRRLVPAAWAGREDGYLEKIDLAVPADADEAIKRGYRSVAVLPLFENGRAIGIFALYAEEADVFDEEELTVLNEVADDISFVLDHLKKKRRSTTSPISTKLPGCPTGQCSRTGCSNGSALPARKTRRSQSSSSISSGSASSTRPWVAGAGTNCSAKLPDASGNGWIRPIFWPGLPPTTSGSASAAATLKSAMLTGEEFRFYLSEMNAGSPKS